MILQGQKICVKNKFCLILLLSFDYVTYVPVVACRKKLLCMFNFWHFTQTFTGKMRLAAAVARVQIKSEMIT